VIPDIAGSHAPLIGGDDDGMNPIDVHDTRPGGPHRQERSHRVAAPESLAEAIEEIGMVQVHTCVSVHCDQCRTSLGSPGFEAHWATEDAALDAATAAGWLVDLGGRLWCSACGPVLTCEAEGHEFSLWQGSAITDALPVLSEYRHCRRCGLHESRPATLMIGDEPR
jgi:ferredoxin